MKTLKRLLILLLLLFLLLGFAHLTRAQDSIPQWPVVEYRGGFKETHYAFICVKYNAKDTVSHLYSCYPHKMWVSVNGGTAVLMKRKTPLDIKAEHFTVVFTRKHYKRTYKF